MSYSRRQLEAFGEPLGESVTRLKPGGRIYGGGGGGGPSTTTVNQSNVPDWLRPQVETVLGGAMKELFQTKAVGGKPALYDESGNLIRAQVLPTYEITGTKPFTPYSTDPSAYVAGFSPLQQQVQANVANLQVPGQFGQATGFANAAGQGGLESAQRAYGYGNAGFQSGQLGQALGLAAAQQAEERARVAEQAGYGYGQAGYQAGLQGQQSGLLGQQLGISGGQYYGGQGAGYGQQAAALAPEAQAYGRSGADIGMMGLRAEQLGRDITGQARGYAQQAADMGSLYGQMATSPGVYQQYMSPYQQMVTDLQIQGAQRQADIARTQRSSQAARAGAFGGARQAIENAEAERALQSQLQNIQAQGLQSAYQQAQQNIAQRAQLGLQGLSGAQAGLGTALQGGQLGLSGIGQAMAGQQLGISGLGQAGQLYGTGIQGAGLGLQGVQAQLAGTAQGMQGAQAAMQGAQTGLSGVDRAIAAGQLGLAGTDRGLAGTAQGMQGAQVGLQGVSGAQAGYGLANQAASNLANIGTQQLGAQTGILNLQNQIGAQQQAQEQAKINQAIQNYAQAQEAPMTALNQFNALLRGYAVPGQTATQYQAQPTLANQITGFGTAGIGALALSNAMGKT